VIRRLIFSISVGVARFAGPDGAPLLLGVPAGKGMPALMARRLLAAYVCLAGLTMLMTTGIAIALALSGSPTRTESCS
jgi:hypothetical protein